MTKTTSTTTKPVKPATKLAKAPKRATSTPKKTTTKVKATTATKKTVTSKPLSEVSQIELVASYQAVMITWIIVNVVFVVAAAVTYINGGTNLLALLWIVFAEIIFFATRAILRARLDIADQLNKT